jgi:hypothetical protein
MQWSVEEQRIPTASFMGDHHPHLESINMRVDPSSSHIMLMELRGEPDAEGRLGYVLRFNKNGEFISSELLTAPAEPVEPPVTEPGVIHHSTHSTGSKKK